MIGLLVLSVALQAAKQRQLPTSRAKRGDILVLMEWALQLMEQCITIHKRLSCFNPCLNGMGTSTGEHVGVYRHRICRFNPCLNGMGTSTWGLHCAISASHRSFNPCLNGMGTSTANSFYVLVFIVLKPCRPRLNFAVFAL